MKRTLLLFASTVIFLVSCRNSGRKIPVDEMKTIMWDMVCADELYAESSTRDSTLKIKKDNFRLYEQVFAAHKISKETFYNSLNYYQSHPDDFKTLMDSLQTYSSMQRNRPIKPAPKPLPR